MANLPVRGDTHDQEQRSISKLKSILPKELFIIRKEGDTDGCSDYGVDIMLELRQSIRYVTNYRSQLQLKCVRNSLRNDDRTFSYSIQLSTLNYLMNQPNSLFAIFLENENVIVWEWISEIFQVTQDRKIDINSPKQDSFTYRFTRVLDSKACEDIYATILHRGQVFREVSEFITKEPNLEGYNAAILLKEGKIQSIDEIAKAIKQGGFALVNDGQAALVNKMLDKLPQAYFKKDPEIAIVYAYVKFNLGFTTEALSWIPRGSLRGKLDSDKKALACFIEIHLQFSLNILSKEQYVEKLVVLEREYGTSTLGLQVKLERIRRSIGRVNCDKIKNVILEMEETNNELLKKEISSSTRIYAEIFAWELEGWKLISDLGTSMSTQKIRFKLGHPMPLQERIELGRSLMNRNTVWMEKYRKLQEQMKDRPALYGQVVISGSTTILRIIAQNRIDKNNEDSDDEKILREIFDNIKLICPQLQKIGLHSLALRGKLLEADILEGLGDLEKSKEIVQEVADDSSILGLSDVEALANDELLGLGIFSSVEKAKKELSVSKDEMMLNTSEQEISKMASYVMEAFGLPEKRKTIIIKELTWLRADAECRRIVCKHIQTIQDLTHSKSIETMYKVDPPRIFKCMKYGYESDIESTDRESLFKLFTWNYCDKCKKEPS